MKMPSNEEIERIKMYDRLKDQNNEIQEKNKELILENENLKTELESINGSEN